MKRDLDQVALEQITLEDLLQVDEIKHKMEMVDDLLILEEILEIKSDKELEDLEILHSDLMLVQEDLEGIQADQELEALEGMLVESEEQDLVVIMAEVEDLDL